MGGVKIWDNERVHVVKGASGVLISLPNEAAKRLAMLLWRHEDEDRLVFEGREDLDALTMALCDLLLAHPRTASALPSRYISTLAETVNRT